MKNHKIKIPKKLSDKNILKYFKDYGLDIINQSYINESKNDNLSIQKIVYPPEIQDLYRLHEFIILNKRITILEFGCGWSSLVMLNALLINKKKYLKKIENLRYQNPFKIFILDNEKKYLNICEQRIKKIFKKNSSHANYNFSEVQMSLFNGKISNNYKKLPMVNPDFIYLDGPDQLNIKKHINGINIGHKDFMPMNSDILMLEPFLKPGTIIVTDGRTANFRFLCNNLQRSWIFYEDHNCDQHYLYLKEKPLGKPNFNQLKFYQKK